MAVCYTMDVRAFLCYFVLGLRNQAAVQSEYCSTGEKLFTTTSFMCNEFHFLTCFCLVTENAHLKFSLSASAPNSCCYNFINPSLEYFPELGSSKEENVIKVKCNIGEGKMPEDKNDMLRL